MTDDGEDDVVEPLLPVHGYFTDVSQAEKSPPKWVIEGVLPEGLVFMAGPPKESFKSTITMALAALVAQYKCTVLPPEWQPKLKGPVMIWSHEADAGELRFILEDGLGVKLSAEERILVCDRPEEFRLDEPEGQDQMMHWLDERKPALAVIDPLANAHSLQEKDSGEMIRIIAPLRRWAKSNGCCLLVVHHTRKLEEDRQFKAADMRGTGALLGLCDGILTMSPAQGPLTVQIDAIFKRAKPWNKVIQLAAWDMKDRQQGGEPLRPVHHIVLKQVAHKFRTVEAIVEHAKAGGAESIKKYIQFLVKMGLLRWSGQELRLTDEGKKVIEKSLQEEA